MEYDIFDLFIYMRCTHFGLCNVNAIANFCIMEELLLSGRT